MSAPTSEAEVRAALLDKYRRMIALRRAELARSARDAIAIRELATRYPGALRELDRAPLEILEARCASLERGPMPSWAEPTWTWHRQLRWALAVRRAAGAERDRERARAIFEGDAEALGFTPSELETLMNPPDGRLSRWLVRRLAGLRGASAVDLEALLFGHLVGHLGQGR